MDVFCVSLRILFVFCDAWLAAEFHFLVAVNFGHGIPHGTESVSADDALVRGIAFNSRVAGSGAGSECDRRRNQCRCHDGFHRIGWSLFFVCFLKAKADTSSEAVIRIILRDQREIFGERVIKTRTP